MSVEKASSQSTSFYAHIGGMDAYARGAKIAAGEVSFADLETYMLEKGEAAPSGSGRQELIENLINEYI